MRTAWPGRSLSFPLDVGWYAARRLFELLSSAPSGCVVLVCGPAGSGKTELVHSWVKAAGLARLAWVGVEPGEQDAQHFWLSVIHALATAAGVEYVERIDRTPVFRGEALSSGCSPSSIRWTNRPCW